MIISRRRFAQSAFAMMLIPAFPSFTLADTPAIDKLFVRQSWESFRNGPHFQAFVNAIKTMRTNKNPKDINSWLYWANVHYDHCPHHLPYFLAWHRGYLHLFEAQLRKISQKNDLVLPYWDYYTNAKLPEEFLDTSSPLYIDGRVSDNVQNALTLNPFADTLKQFPRNPSDGSEPPNAFESSIEELPHDEVHNLIGGVMANFQSPQDPIFWLHHANIDRLWAAWVKADNGRKMPPGTDAYWIQNLDYGSGVSLPGIQTISTMDMGYVYEDDVMPNKIPSAGVPVRPEVRRLQALPPQTQGLNTLSLGGGQHLSLDENSVSVEVPLAEQARSHLQALVAKHPNEKNAYSSIRIVLDNVVPTELGKKGGYYYKVYVNLPDRKGSELGEDAYLLGTLGAFEIAIRQHHAGGTQPAQITFDATAALQKISPQQLDSLSVSFIRVDGSRQVKGTVINVDEFRVIASTLAVK